MPSLEAKLCVTLVRRQGLVAADADAGSVEVTSQVATPPDIATVLVVEAVAIGPGRSRRSRERHGSSRCCGVRRRRRPSPSPSRWVRRRRPGRPGTGSWSCAVVDADAAGDESHTMASRCQGQARHERRRPPRRRIWRGLMSNLHGERTVTPEVSESVLQHPAASPGAFRARVHPHIAQPKPFGHLGGGRPVTFQHQCDFRRVRGMIPRSARWATFGPARRRWRGQGRVRTWSAARRGSGPGP